MCSARQIVTVTCAAACAEQFVRAKRCSSVFSKIRFQFRPCCPKLISCVSFYVPAADFDDAVKPVNARRHGGFASHSILHKLWNRIVDVK